jgi:hypothetical protein
MRILLSPYRTPASPTSRLYLFPTPLSPEACLATPLRVLAQVSFKHHWFPPATPVCALSAPPPWASATERSSSVYSSSPVEHTQTKMQRERVCVFITAVPITKLFVERVYLLVPSLSLSLVDTAVDSPKLRAWCVCSCASKRPGQRKVRRD